MKYSVVVFCLVLGLVLSGCATSRPHHYSTANSHPRCNRSTTYAYPASYPTYHGGAGDPFTVVLFMLALVLGVAGAVMSDTQFLETGSSSCI